jgi:cytochrome P450
MVSTADALVLLPLFEGCAPEDLEPVVNAITGVRHAVEGELICAEGDKAESWWIVLEGTADVTTAGLYTATIGPGETIGELALLDDQPRAATVRAATDMVLEEVGGDAFLTALLARPRLAVALLRQMAARLRLANRPRTQRPVAPGRALSGPSRRPPASVAEATVFDPRAPGYRADPYPQLAALRRSAPVHRCEAMDGYVVLRYEDVHRLTRDKSLTGSITTGSEVVRAASSGGPPRMGRTDKMMIRRDGDDHTRLRRLVTKAFTPRAVRAWQERTESIVDEGLAAAAEAGRIDVMTDYALPLPSRVISEMLGVPARDMTLLHEWSHLLVSNFEPFPTPERQKAVEEAGRAMFGYLEELIADKRDSPGEDVLTAMLQAEETDDRLDDEEVQAQVMLLYIAGHETTVNLIGNGLHHLFRHPDQLDRLRRDPELDANAVEEFLRFDSPAQFTRRVTHAPMELGGVSIPAGSLVLGLASANHDPDKWGPTADVVDVTRAGANEHVSFGSGPHFCLGAALARMEGQIALGRLVRRFPDMQPDSPEPAWAPSVVLRGLEALPVTLGAPQ